MQFITVRDLRSRASQIWRQLPEEKEIILTLNGKPIAIISAISGENMEESLAIMRRVRAMTAVASMQLEAKKSGADRMSMREINKEIAAVRKPRRSK